MSATDRHTRQARSSRPWERYKARVLRTMGTTCHLCGQPGADSADHIIPVSHGGTTSMDNLAPVHHLPCNVARGNRSVQAARAELWGTKLPAPGEYVKLPDGGWLNHRGDRNSRQW